MPRHGLGGHGRNVSPEQRAQRLAEGVRMGYICPLCERPTHRCDESPCYELGCPHRKAAA